MAMLVACALTLLLTYGQCSENVEPNYCQVVQDYANFKSSLDSFLASQDDHCRRPYNLTDGGSPFKAYCDMSQQGGGWMVIQRRQDGTEDFYRTWFEYMDGFGNLSREFWLGNEKIHRVTSQGRYQLRVDLGNTTSFTKFATYDRFRVANMTMFYSLTVDGYSGDAGDALHYHNNSRFSAWNLDVDGWDNHCALSRQGAWWFRNCALCHLNGVYSHRGEMGIYWYYENYKQAVMKIRPI